MTPRKKRSKAPEPAARVSLKQYAEHRGISPQATSKAIKAGVLTEVSAVKAGLRW